MYNLYFWNKLVVEIAISFFSAAALGVVVTAFAYFKVFQIIRRHQQQVQKLNGSAFDMLKYKKVHFYNSVHSCNFCPQLRSFSVLYTCVPIVTKLWNENIQGDKECLCGTGVVFLPFQSFAVLLEDKRD